MTSSVLALALVLGGDVVLTGHGARANSVAFSADGKQLASGASDGTILVWDVAKGALAAQESLEGGSKIVDVAWRGGTVIAATTLGQLVEWVPADKKENLTLKKVHDGSWASSIVGSWDSEEEHTTAVASYDGTVWFHQRFPQDATIEKANAKVGAIGAVALHPTESGKLLVVPSSSSKVSAGVAVVSMAETVPSVVLHEMKTSNGAIAARGEWIAAAGKDSVYVWKNGKAIPFPGSGSVTSLAISPSGDRLAAGSDGGVAKVWNLAKLGAPPQYLEGHAHTVTDVAFSPDGKRLATSSKDGTVRLWDLSMTRPTAATLPPASPIVFVTNTPLGEGCIAAAAAHLGKDVPLVNSGGKEIAGAALAKVLLATPACTELDSTRVYRALSLDAASGKAKYVPFDFASTVFTYAVNEIDCVGTTAESLTLQFKDGAALPVVGQPKHPDAIPYATLEGKEPAAPTLKELPKRPSTTEVLTPSWGFSRLELKRTYAKKSGDPGKPNIVAVERAELTGWLAESKEPVLLHIEEGEQPLHEAYASATVTDLVVTDLDGDSRPELLFRNEEGGVGLVRVFGGKAGLEWLLAPADIVGDGC